VIESLVPLKAVAPVRIPSGLLGRFPASIYLDVFHGYRRFGVFCWPCAVRDCRRPDPLDRPGLGQAARRRSRCGGHRAASGVRGRWPSKRGRTGAAARVTARRSGVRQSLRAGRVLDRIGGVAVAPRSRPEGSRAWSGCRTQKTVAEAAQRLGPEPVWLRVARWVVAGNDPAAHHLSRPARSSRVWEWRGTA
jgi:hypothetical protein